MTAHVSLPGRHLVYMPTSDRGGVSRRIADDKERRRLSKVLKAVAPKKGALIARTVALGVSADALAAVLEGDEAGGTEPVEMLPGAHGRDRQALADPGRAQRTVGLQGFKDAGGTEICHARIMPSLFLESIYFF